jgi:hypothetical protein
VEALDQLLYIREGVAEIKNKILGMNQELQHSGKAAMIKVNKLDLLFEI